MNLHMRRSLPHQSGSCPSAFSDCRILIYLIRFAHRTAYAVHLSSTECARGCLLVGRPSRSQRCTTGRLSFTFEHMSYVFALVLVEVNNGDQPVSVSLVLFHHPVSVELAKLFRIIRCQVAFVAQVLLRGVAPVIQLRVGCDR
jgi:hypothetical protein